MSKGQRLKPTYTVHAKFGLIVVRNLHKTEYTRTQEPLNMVKGQIAK